MPWVSLSPTSAWKDVGSLTADLCGIKGLGFWFIRVLMLTSMSNFPSWNSWWLKNLHYTSPQEYLNALCILLTTQSSLIWLPLLAFQKHYFQNVSSPECSFNGSALGFDPSFLWINFSSTWGYCWHRAVIYFAASRIAGLLTNAPLHRAARGSLSIKPAELEAFPIMTHGSGFWIPAMTNRWDTLTEIAL